MSSSKMGANVMYCGHNGWFVADIFVVAGANVVKAGGPVDGSNLIRGRNSEATHILVDSPSAGCWAPERGLFVVPRKQVRVIKPTHILLAGTGKLHLVDDANADFTLCRRDPQLVKTTQAWQDDSTICRSCLAAHWKVKDREIASEQATGASR